MSKRSRSTSASDARVLSLVGCIGGVVFEFDGEARYLNAWTDDPALLARPVDAMLGKTIEEVLGPSAGAPFTAVVRRVFRTGVVEQIEYPLDVQGGSRWFLADVKRVETDGDATVVFFARDVTETRRMERDLAASESRYRSLFEQNPVPLYVFDPETLDILDANAAALRLYRYTRAEMLAMKTSDIRPESEVPRLRAALERVSVETQDMGTWTHRTKTGELLDVEITAQLVELNGRRAMLASARDVTAQLRLARAIRESEQRYRTLFECGRSPMYLWHPDTLRFVQVNDAAVRLYGYSRDEMLAMTLAEVLAPEDHRVLERVRDRSAFPFDGEVTHLKDDGTRLTVHVDASLVELDGHDLVFSVVHDLTERRQLQQQLAHAQKMEAVGRLAGGVAHDFNNIIAAIVADASWIAESLGPTHPLTEDANTIVATGERAAALTRQLLAFSSRQPSQPVELNVNDAVRNVQRMLRRLIGEDIELSCDLDPSLGTIVADPTQIEQVILNFAVNARDAMPRGGTLTIRTRSADVQRERDGVKPGRYVVIEVEDTGCGMDEATRTRIFEPFFTTKEPGRGTGLGLSTVFGIVEQSSGHIVVRSEPGAGATFTVFFSERSESCALAQETSLHPPKPAAGATVLVVEDDEQVLRVVARTLRSGGYHVIEAKCAHDALTIASCPSASIDLLLSDIVMPGADGTELARLIRADRPHLPVLLVSGYSDRGATIDATAHMLKKPFTPTQLRRAVGEALRPTH